MEGNEILMEERHQQQETMRRENRRVQAMSWGSSGSDDPPPPKPSRFPVLGADSSSLASITGTLESSTNMPAPTTYIVAQNPEVLIQLLRENESRGISPSVYTTPATGFNTLAVDFEKHTSSNSHSPNVPANQNAPSSQPPVIYGISKKVIAKNQASSPSSANHHSPPVSPNIVTSSSTSSTVSPSSCSASPVLRKVKPKTKEMSHHSNLGGGGGNVFSPSPPASLTNSSSAVGENVMWTSSLVSSVVSDGVTISSASFTSSFGAELESCSGQPLSAGLNVAEDDVQIYPEHGYNILTSSPLTQNILNTAPRITIKRSSNLAVFWFLPLQQTETQYLQSSPTFHLIQQKTHTNRTPHNRASQDTGEGELDLEQQLLEQRLRQQQRESEEDSRWLAEEETTLKKRLSIATSLSDAESADGGVDHSPVPHTPPPFQKSRDSPPSTLSSGRVEERSSTPLSNGSAEERVIVVKKMEPTPTADLDRTNDKVYECTTSVVKAVMSLSQGVQQSKADQYLELVRRVGMELRSLLSSVDFLVPIFPISAHREVEMAHKVLSKDMGELVNAMKLAQKYTPTTLDAEYRKGMLSAAHILAMDAKNLLDVIDSIRIRYSEVNSFICTVVHPVVQNHCEEDDVQNQRFQEDPKLSVQDVTVVGSLERHKKTSQNVIPPQPQYSITKKLPLVAASHSTSPPSQTAESAPAPVSLDS
uniref:Focal AT domain-containing protein n=1 Tax=Timema genevievae TaxID=629358 RepID=A0A7R9PMN5_TIMGE|nr:unnamed protein product [Timema genevievae]